MLCLVAVTVAFVGLACTGTSMPQSVDGPGSRSQRTALQVFQDMLDRRAAALMEGRPSGYLKGLTPAARRVERAIAEGALSVPLTLIDPAVRAGNVNRAQDQINDARTDLLFEYEGIPADNPFRIRLVNDLRREGNRWRVTNSVIDSDEVVPPQWVLEDTDFTRKRHFLALHRPGLEVKEILALAEQARAELRRKMPIPPDEVHLVQLAADSEEYELLLGMPDRTPDSAAIASYEFSAASGVSALPVNRHMIVDLESVLGNRDAIVFEERSVYPRAVFQHELAHLLLSRYSRELLPDWVGEGAAMYLADERLVDIWRAGIEEDVFGKVVTIESMTRKPPPPLLAYDYAYANAATLYLVEEFGEDEFFEFYKGFKNYATSRSVSMAGRRVEAVQGLLRIHYDISDNQLDRATMHYIRRAVQ